MNTTGFRAPSVASLAKIMALAFAACGGDSKGTLTDAGVRDGATAGTDGSWAQNQLDASLGGAIGTGGDGGSAALGGSSGQADAGVLVSVNFHYKPDWNGATTVAVVGGFGVSGDWKTPFVQLTKGIDGTFSGSAMLAAGRYSFFYEIRGDSAATNPGLAIVRVIDPELSDYTVCPPASPTAMKNQNPCSVMVVPQGLPPALFRVRGSVEKDGAGASGWMVLVERDEMGSHHFGVNRATVDANGRYDFALAAGSYRVQALPPDEFTNTDSRRLPLASELCRRAISSSFKVGADVAVESVDIAYHDYAHMSPSDGKPANLPVVLNFSLLPNVTAARAAVYGEGMNVGDPWWVSDYGRATTAVFDGKFTTMQAGETMATGGKDYWWGTWQQGAKGAGGVSWVRQSMVFPLTFP